MKKKLKQNKITREFSDSGKNLEEIIASIIKGAIDEELYAS